MTNLIASLFKAFLINEGYDVVSFTDPALALEYYNGTWDRHSLLITDYRMPSICGIDLAKKVREFNSQIKIFLMTAFETKDLEESEDFQVQELTD